MSCFAIRRHLFASVVAVDILFVFVSDCVCNYVILHKSTTSLLYLLSLFPDVVCSSGYIYI